jgi:hypothetical protein
VFDSTNITRRDFLNGVMIGAGTTLLGGATGKGPRDVIRCTSSKLHSNRLGPALVMWSERG